jgi:aminopeptidase-like protein
MIVKKYYKIGKYKLYPICRSITGKGLKKTLKIIKRYVPELKIIKIKSGTKVFDWKVPPEWNVKSAYVQDEKKNKIIDFKKNNLHLMGYSVPVKKKISKKKLFQNLHFRQDLPNAIPYVTSYYEKKWGFCVSFNNYKKIFKKYKYNDYFNVNIDSNFNKSGYLDYGEVLLKGVSKQEILISTYICHPSMANNELSGPILSLSLIDYFKKKKLKKTLRFLFIPETIGSICFLYKNLDKIKTKVIGGYNLSCVGDERNYSCMFSKYSNSLSDYSLIQAFKALKIKYKKYSFLARGSDERQFNSPHVDLKITSFFRTKYGNYKEYHTSLDDFSLVTEKGIRGSFEVMKKSITNLINLKIPVSRYLCEPQMGKRNLYAKINTSLSKGDLSKETKEMMNFLQYSDGLNDLKKISLLINVSYKRAYQIFKVLKNNNLIF